MPNFGLTNSVWNNLTGMVSTVYHCGAIVNFVKPLKYMREVNVDGTATILKLCYEAGAKLVHISTLGIFSGSVSGTRLEQASVPPPRFGGYPQSKWLAEQLVLSALKTHKFQATIIRLGTIGPDSKTGAANSNDTFSRLVTGLIDIGVTCSGNDVDNPLPKSFQLVPVDWTAQAIVR